MSQQVIRQKARRAALDVAARARQERAEREKRIEGHAVEVLTAVGERDAAVAAAEQRAGTALRAMADEGLTVREMTEWCGDEISVKEATRLKGLADDVASDPSHQEAVRQPSGLQGGGVGGTTAAG